MASPEAYPEANLSASSFWGGNFRKFMKRYEGVSRKEKEDHKGRVTRPNGAQFHWHTLRDSMDHFSYPNGVAKKQGYLSTNFCHWLRTTSGNINSPALPVFLACSHFDPEAGKWPLRECHRCLNSYRQVNTGGYWRHMSRDTFATGHVQHEMKILSMKVQRLVLEELELQGEKWRYSII